MCDMSSHGLPSSVTEWKLERKFRVLVKILRQQFVTMNLQIVTKQFKHVSVASLRPCHVQVQSEQKKVTFSNLFGINQHSLSLIDAAQLHQKTIKSTIFHLLQQFVLHHVGMIFKKLEMCVEASANFWHN